MAISQTRMLALIKIADDFKSQLLFFNRTISSAIRDLPPSPTPADLLSTIQQIQNINNSLTLSPIALETLATEKAHFKQNAARNARMALKARLKRGQDLEHVAPRSTAPDAISLRAPKDFETFFDKSTKTALPRQAPTTQIYSGAAAPYSQIAPLPDDQLPDLNLANHKIEINNFCKKRNAPEPYPDPYDDSIPLTLDHKIHLGLPIDEDDSLF